MDREQLLHLCNLARLKLAETDIEAFEAKFGSMLDFVHKMMAYQPDGSGPPLTLIEELELRPDQPRDFDWPAGTTHEYRVPRIINFAGGED
jgi:aspartyl/glutamyl-tRNA(Asn/Gln) amidotransferase C subunit